ncbi:hypothetical protein PWP89_16285 [Stenotrophomonas rhizophila]|uniref:hypothetical protein n=1 Tax=Stenotrophomonas rhizophila TaxID=216778 RepID=UPI000B80F77E|nr:hypothetical protein [Stenotrophomonas rhizophila]
MAPHPISTDLQQAFAAFATAAAQVSTHLIPHLARVDVDSVYRLEEAQSNGYATMLAIDTGADPQVRFVAVGPDQVVMQIAALGVFPPSDRKN